jgi:ABC-type antimicrobial peptide transport system permease subunit
MPLGGITAAVKAKIGEANPSIQIVFQSFHSVIQNSLRPDRLTAMLSGFFGALAAILATIGLYGVISFMVARRRNEIGIRMALGASRGNILSLVLREGMWLAGMGIAVGLLCAAGLTQLVAKSLFGINPLDTVTFAGSSSLLFTVTILATYFPARRATRVDPNVALRYE